MFPRVNGFPLPFEKFEPTQEESDVLHLFLQHGKEWDVTSASILLIHYSINKDIVEKLLSVGANPNIVDKEGRSAVLTSVESENMEAFQLLLENGADPLIAVGHFRTISLFKLINTNSMTYFSDHIFPLMLSLPQIKNQPMTPSLSNFYLNLIECIAECYMSLENDSDEENVKQLLQLLINSNENIVNMICELRTGYVYVKGSLKVKPVEALIGFLTRYYCSMFRGVEQSYSKTISGFINIMISLGFTFSNNSIDCLDALTSLLLLGREGENNSLVLSKNTLDLILKHIDINIESIVLSHHHSKYLKQYTQYSDDIINFKNKLLLSDVLFLVWPEIHYVKKFVAHWWGPPLVLITLGDKKNVAYRNNWAGVRIISMDYKSRLEALPHLLEYGGVPHGTELFRRVDQTMTDWYTLLENEDKINFESNWQNYQQIMSK